MVRLKPPPLTLLDDAALFLDFDGTLVELADTPGAIRVPTGLTDLLDRLRRRLDGRLAIVSGRSLEDLERHVGFAGIACSGSHGIELRLADGSHLPLSVPIGLEGMKDEVRAFAAGTEGLLVEEKPAGLALHFRRSPGEAERVGEFMTATARKHGMKIQRGKMVVELKPDGATKGDAIRAFMTEPDFEAARPVFVGDDLTDEDGFEAASALGGAGILVGPMRRTAASWRLSGVPQVFEWLSAAA